MKKIIIAIDGCSATGKSTLARALARALGYLYIDSGALYRAVTLFSLRSGMWGARLDRERLIGALDQLQLSFESDAEGSPVLRLEGEDVEAELRSPAVSKRVGEVAALPELRHHLLDLQRALGAQQGVVMDGRDIGTVVFPKAALKLFLSASPEVRARRRYEELHARGVQISLDKVLHDLEQRDRADASRSCAPLRKAPDAIEIDNSQLSRADQLQRALALARERIQN